MARFEIGNPGGPGRPKRQTEAGYMRVLMDACDLTQWQAVCERAVTDAAAGEPKAREWLGRYLVGAPEATAPAPMEVVVGELLHDDPALSRAVKLLAAPEISRAQFPSLHEADAHEDAVRAEARAAILAAGDTEQN